MSRSVHHTRQSQHKTYGAKIETPAPKLEYDALESVMSVAPTTVAFAARAGLYEPRSISLPICRYQKETYLEVPQHIAITRRYCDVDSCANSLGVDQYIASGTHSS